MFKSIISINHGIIMFLISLAFLSGIMLLQQFHRLPPMSWAIVIILAAPLFFFSQFRRIYFKLPIFMALGFSWCLIYAHLESRWELPANLEGKTIQITGTIASIPEINDHRISFLFSLDSIQSENQTHKASGLVHLSWQNPKQKLHVGDQWQVSTHLKKIHGMMNPGGFDYEAWCFQEGVRAAGYIYHDTVKFINSHWYHYPRERIREYLYNKIIISLPLSRTSEWIPALALGIRQGIHAEDWQVLRNTGTNHLMAIAGLHIGFMSSFIYMLFNWAWRRVPLLTLKLPAQQAAGIAALLTALIYGTLAGFSLPTERACFMLAIFFVILLMRRNTVAWHAWSLALLVVLLLNPLCVLTESFWLSFGSVALIIYGVSGRLYPSGLWWKLGRIQWILTLGLVPLSIWLFQECSFVSFIANAIAIPWIGFLIVPFVLLGCFVLLFSVKAGGLILLFSDKLLAVLWSILVYLSHIPGAVWYHAVPHVYFLWLSYVGIVLLLLPIGFPGRWFGLFLLLPFFLYRPLAPGLGEAWVTLLDVGQGLSSVIQTQKHILVFDTGLRLNDNFDMGRNVVLPFLHTIAAKKIDMMVISHRDNDHSGGARSIIERLPVSQIKTSAPELFFNMNASYCLQGEGWKWDGVDFQFLYPSSEQLGLDNNSSCVLKVTTRCHQVLLPGDIEKAAEKYLLNSARENLASEILIAPHHGSKTSGVEEFIEAVHPKIVLFPVGYRNVYNFPNKAVVGQYKSIDAQLYDSVADGAIQLKLTKNENLALELYRLENQHYWNR